MSESGWRLCIDFGTALSKAAVAPTDADAFKHPDLVRPLPLAGAVGARNPFLLPGAIFIEKGVVHLGPAALARVEAVGDPKREALQSFKTLLSARDLEASLGQTLSRTIDPEGAFQQRDLIVLYLGYLTHLAHEAIRADRAIPVDPDRLLRRYARPAWRPNQTAEGHVQVSRLFDEAQLVASALGPALAAPEGIDLQAASDAVRAARRQAGSASLVEGAVFEATAAAACHFGALGKGRSGPLTLLTLDIGAGTTDVAAIGLDGQDGAIEITSARRTVLAAGDAIDALLLNLFLEKAKSAKTVEARTALWRRLLTVVRAQKEQLFAERSAAIRYDGKVIVAKLGELEGHPDFKTLKGEMEQAFVEGLEAAGRHAQAAGRSEVAVVLAGGGSRLPFAQELARKAKVKGGKVKPRLAPITPEWAHHESFGGNLAPILPQLAIAIGGALAAPDLLMARSDGANVAA